MRHKLLEISPEELEATGEELPEYCFKVRFFDPDGITIFGDLDGEKEFPDIQTEKTFRVDINHEPEVMSPSVKTRFKEEVIFNADYKPDVRQEQVTLYKHRKKDTHFADYEWYTSSVYIKPKVTPTHHKTTVFLYPEENYISSVTHEIEQAKPVLNYKVNDVYYDVTMNKDVITTKHLSTWDAKFTLDEDQLEMQLRELDNFRNKLKHENIPTIYEGIGLGNTCQNSSTRTNLNKYGKNHNQLTLNTCVHLDSFADEITKKGDVTHRIADENSSNEDAPSPDYVDVEGVDGRSFEELDV